MGRLWARRHTPRVAAAYLGSAISTYRIASRNAVQLGHNLIEEGARMTACVPVRDMKSTSAFVELVERESEITVTKNGREAMH